MKRKIIQGLFFALLLITEQSVAQNGNDCKPLFSALADHALKECEHKEFQELEIYPKAGAKAEVRKGVYEKVAYAFSGDFNKRPAAAQIYQNYVNAITKAGGEITANNSNGVCGKLKKNGDTYWIKIYTDGSSWYWYESLKEASLRQDVVPTADEIKMALKDDGKAVFYGIYFDTDKATLKPESAPTLEAIAAFLKANPSANIFVVGHTDNSGSFEHNLALSKDRAGAVIGELVAKHGVNKNQLAAQGVASLAPIASNDAEAGKARNRRVEIVKR
ncbi:OmpA family protein [Taibaiella koreensis]|uniref:OmpA family protein n=1 Tax=Taibaiella koreensis TaxID=1268548 RepID=UPI000E59B2BC|nr:OmpA family protein [Taibaiella koreensis]